MSIFDEMKMRASKLSELIDELLAMDNEELYGENRLHDLSFEREGKESFKKVFAILSDLKRCNLERIPIGQIEPLDGILGVYKDLFSQAKELDLQSDGSPKASCAQIIASIEDNYVTLYDHAAPLISFANIVGTDFKTLEREASALLEGARKISQEKVQSLDTHLANAQETLKNIKLVAAESGVEKTSFHFSSMETTHKKKAHVWLVAGSILLGFLLVSVVTFAWQMAATKSGLPFIFGYLEAGFLMAVSLLFYSVHFCKKNYESEKHNQTINANKALSLKTFRAFVDGTDSQRIKDIITQTAANAAFHTPRSGFSKEVGDHEVPLPPNAHVLQNTIDDMTTTKQ